MSSNSRELSRESRTGSFEVRSLAESAETIYQSLADTTICPLLQIKWFYSRDLNIQTVWLNTVCMIWSKCWCQSRRSHVPIQVRTIDYFDSTKCNSLEIYRLSCSTWFYDLQILNSPIPHSIPSERIRYIMRLDSKHNQQIWCIPNGDVQSRLKHLYPYNLTVNSFVRMFCSMTNPR